MANGTAAGPQPRETRTALLEEILATKVTGDVDFKRVVLTVERLAPHGYDPGPGLTEYAAAKYRFKAAEVEREVLCKRRAPEPSSIEAGARFARPSEPRPTPEEKLAGMRAAVAACWGLDPRLSILKLSKKTGHSRSILYRVIGSANLAELRAAAVRHQAATLRRGFRTREGDVVAVSRDSG